MSLILLRIPENRNKITKNPSALSTASGVTLCAGGWSVHAGYGFSQLTIGPPAASPTLLALVLPRTPQRRG
ncbi:hypothetical protein B0T14DRAFT_505153 [Immersiella caudata]|uniref:Uncharacterized protein n=1 Tax=Immersiella caudata TaxID=314043 RepID=A0AA39XF39_9PEZI|nr:hypothetical protein B0T14DRAFT_505153 [Immersiella caudata]